MITVGFSYLFVIDDFRVQGVITISQTALVAMLLLLELQLETPFQGVSDIKPVAMECVLQEINAMSLERGA